MVIDRQIDVFMHKYDGVTGGGEGRKQYGNNGGDEI